MLSFQKQFDFSAIHLFIKSPNQIEKSHSIKRLLNCDIFRLGCTGPGVQCESFSLICLNKHNRRLPVHIIYNNKHRIASIFFFSCVSCIEQGELRSQIYRKNSFIQIQHKLQRVYTYMQNEIEGKPNLSTSMYLHIICTQNTSP